MQKPNIVYFFVDDMGYGDVSCLNPEGKIPTPNFDRLADEGMVFTDAHSTSSVCSPSRYGVLTGRYNWRSSLQKGIVRPYSDSLIDKDRMTVPKLMAKNGYHTACIGKWHLGMGWDFDVTEDFLPPRNKNRYIYEQNLIEPTIEQKELWEKAFSKTVKGGPIEAGFEYYFGVDAQDWPPFCFIENDKTVGTPSAWLQPRLLGNNLAAFQGPAMPYWNFEQLLPTFSFKAKDYIKKRAENEEPFFLYMPMTSPHTPLAVNKKWIGQSGLDNLYADLVMETDDIFGTVLDALDEYGLTDNTLVIFTSDNGCAPYIGIDQMEAQGHFPSANLRGYKTDAWDGGHRMPFIARWPDAIKAGTVCDELVCQSDLMATCADMINDTIPDSAGEDSITMMPLFKEQKNSYRDSIIHHSLKGKFAIRDKQWKLLLCPGSGGWAMEDSVAYNKGLPMVQLYDMQQDVGEMNNLCKKHPEIVRSMIKDLEQIIDNGRSTLGVKQLNDVPIDIWKLDSIPGIDRTIIDDY